MTTTMAVPETERGQVRVFAVDLTPEAAETWGTEASVARALGVDSLPEGQWELFPVSNLEGLGLTGYLVEGAGADPEPVQQDRARLAALKGHVLLVYSGAVRGKTLTPKAPLRWIGTYGEPVTVAPMDKLVSQAAEEPAAQTPRHRKPPSDAAMSGRIAGLAILVLLALVGVMVWIAG